MEIELEWWMVALAGLYVGGVSWLTYRIGVHRSKRP